ncbi:hypothetical protein BJP36_28910 [Moorena producens JHB]|uniref:Uncharacterized protein n=1 Tax=Moorena producens (strain JHB) TaxID=1454205 RepID=A0A1D9G6R7_MOOP1|nr:hypothetical protein [Moorena producens]AOY83342.1 hypothetical protein BJP36_28910 [Moorena producens JHB]
MAQLNLELHPDKTFIGRISRGFDVLGYWFSPQGLSVAGKTIVRMRELVRRLYEQGASSGRILCYLLLWGRWVRSGLDGVFGVGDRSGFELLVCPSFGSRCVSIADAAGEI